MAVPAITSRTRQLAGELAVVFLGVLLALAADDFGQARSERAEARESLQLLLVDLAADSVEFATKRQIHERKTSDLAWLGQNWNRASIPSDTLEVRLWPLGTRTILQLSGSVYSGLEDSNRLRLVEPDSLRQALLAYYRTRQPDIRRWEDDVHLLANAVVFEHLPEHVVSPLGARPGTFWPPPEPRVGLRSSWPELRADAELHNAVVYYGRVVETLAGLLLGGEEATGALMRMIREEIRS